MSKQIKILNIKSPEKNKDIRFIVLDSEIFDWGIDDDSLNRAKKLIQQKPDMKEAIVMSMVNHFIESFSDFLGRPCTLEDIVQSIEKGSIS